MLAYGENSLAHYGNAHYSDAVSRLSRALNRFDGACTRFMGIARDDGQAPMARGRGDQNRITSMHGGQSPYALSA